MTNKQTHSIFHQLLLSIIAVLCLVIPTQASTYVFLSFTLPQQSLTQWFAQAKAYHGTLVLRGLVNDSVHDTWQALRAVGGTEKNSAPVLFDPSLFERYHITQVPTMVRIKEDQDGVTSVWKAVSGDIGWRAAQSFIDNN